MTKFYSNWKLTLSSILLLSITSIYGQGKITINHKVERFINNESTLQREKYFNIHQLTDLSDPELVAFKNRFDLPNNYRGGRTLDSPMKNVKNDGTFPAVLRNHSGVRSVENRFASGNPKTFFYDKTVDYSTVNMTSQINKLTNYIRDYYKYSEDRVPKYIEPLNEPMIHSDEFYPASGYISSKIDVINTRICELHRELGKKIHASDELKNVKVAGFGSAFPMFENNDFDLWNSRYKKFIDIAGEDVDLFTVHLYDGKGINNDGGRRSGSNVEAILDMIETYSKIKLNTVKPIAITEYGRLVENQQDWNNNIPGAINYESIENSQALRSQMHMSMAFMERGNDIEYTIPFTMAKTKPTSQYSKASLWNRVSARPLLWEYTPRVNFFEIWRGVKGKRVLINSNNIDVQAQAFVNGKKLYVVLNNLNDATQTVNLDLLNKNGLQSVGVKRLKVFLNRTPQLTQTSQTTAPSNISLQYGESAVLTYTFNNNITFNNKIKSKKYYADKYLQPIIANKKRAFNFKNVKTGRGQATIRVSIGRELSASRNPDVFVNDKLITYRGDVIKGYNQSTRSRFFGTLEIPVNINDLKKDDKTVKVQVRFGDNGGHISSVVLQVQNLDNETTTPPRVGNQFYIINRSTGKKIRSTDGSVTGKALEQVSAIWSGDPTRWTKVDTGNGYFHLKNVETDMFFRPEDAADRSKIIQVPSASYAGDYTKWKSIATSDGYFYLKNKFTDMYFRPTSEDDYSELVQRPVSYGGNYTQWKFVNVNSSSSILTERKEDLLFVNGKEIETNIYPNPISRNQRLTIELSEVDISSKLMISNLYGKVIYNKVLTQQKTSISIKNLASGVYFVQILNNKHKGTIKKIIVN